MSHRGKVEFPHIKLYFGSWKFKVRFRLGMSTGQTTLQKKPIFQLFTFSSHHTQNELPQYKRVMSQFKKHKKKQPRHIYGLCWSEETFCDIVYYLKCECSVALSDSDTSFLCDCVWHRSMNSLFWEEGVHCIDTVPLLPNLSTSIFPSLINHRFANNKYKDSMNFVFY